MNNNTKLLIKEIDKNTPNIAMIEKYLKKGAELKWSNNYKDNILYRVIDNLHYIFREKFDKYNNVNIFNNNKETKEYLIKIIEEYDYSIIKKLIENNAYEKGNNLNDWNLLKTATFSFNYKIIEILLNAGVNVNCNDKEDGWKSFLDWIKYDQTVFRDEGNIIAVIGQDLIIDYILRKNAKGWFTKYKRKLGHNLNINRYSKTGLVTDYNLIKISTFKFITKDIRDRFVKWHKECEIERYYLNYPWEKIDNLTDFEKYIEENNKIGYDLSKKIKKYINKETTIVFFKINPEKYFHWRHSGYCTEKISI